MTPLDDAREPDARLRAHRGAQPTVKLHARNLTLTGLGRASWDTTVDHASAIDYLLAATATELVTAFGDEARRADIALDDVELRLEAFFENPLVVAGVIGEQGSPRIATIRGSLYVGTAAAESEVVAPWQRACARSFVLASLAPDVAIDITLKRVD